MAEIMVTASEVHNRAEQLQNLNTQFKSKLETLVSRETALVSKWEGEAREAFHNAFNTDKVKMEEFHAVIGEYVTALNQIATNYEQAESKALAQASSRTA